MVHTQTCAPGCDDRVFTFSVEDVSPYGASGDRAVWNYEYNATLTLRMEWQSAGGGGMATSALVYFRYFDGQQIGTSVWQPVIPPTPQGVLTQTIHLDDNPMDGVYGVAKLDVFELYAVLVGGADHGADTRGAPAVGVGGSGSYARGLFSNNGLHRYDNWNVTDGSLWNTTKWATTSNSSGRLIDVQGKRGRLGGSATSRATSQTADLANADVRLDYEFSDRNSGSDLRVTLRGTGATGSSQMPNGYRLDVDSGTTLVKLKKVVSGTATTIGSFDYNPDDLPGPDPGAHSLRFAVNGSSVKVRMWPACSSSSGPDGCMRFDEPEVWNLEGIDTAVTAPGKVQVTHYNGNGSTRAVYVDDLFLSPPTTEFEVFDDGFIRNDFEWDLGAPAGKQEEYHECEVGGGARRCDYVGRVRFNAWIHLNNRSTDRLEVKLEVLDGPDVRVEFTVVCVERAGPFTPGGSCGRKTWDTVQFGRNWSHNWANFMDQTGFTFNDADDYKLYFTFKVDPVGDNPSGETRINPVYEAGWIDCGTNNVPCRFE